MKIYGLEASADLPDVLLTLREASFAATADEIRYLAQFFQETAEKMEQWGDGFGHEHFGDYCKENGLTSVEGGADVIVARPSRGPHRR